MATFEYVMLVKENVWGTPMANPLAGTDKIYVRLTEGNSFSMQMSPQYIYLPYGGGEAITADALSQYVECRGSFNTRLFPTQAAFLLAWAQERINAAQTAPWTTDQPPGDLASVSAYHCYQRSDGTYKRSRYAGCKVLRWGIVATAGDPVFRLNMDVQAIRSVGNPIDSSVDPDATEFPAPAPGDLPKDPYMLKHTVGGWLLGTGAGTVRTQYEDMNLDVTNIVDARPFESQFAQVISFRGRTSNLSATLRLKASPDDRTAFESLASQRAQLTLNDGTHSVVFNFQGNNKITQLTRDLPLDRTFMYRFQMRNVLDVATGKDIEVATT